jgi:hypothetical protein
MASWLKSVMVKYSFYDATEDKPIGDGPGIVVPVRVSLPTHHGIENLEILEPIEAIHVQQTLAELALVRDLAGRAPKLYFAEIDDASKRRQALNDFLAARIKDEVERQIGK